MSDTFDARSAVSDALQELAREERALEILEYRNARTHKMIFRNMDKLLRDPVLRREVTDLLTKNTEAARIRRERLELHKKVYAILSAKCF